MNSSVSCLFFFLTASSYFVPNTEITWLLKAFFLRERERDREIWRHNYSFIHYKICRNIREGSGWLSAILILEKTVKNIYFEIQFNLLSNNFEPLYYR